MLFHITCACFNDLIKEYPMLIDKVKVNDNGKYYIFISTMDELFSLSKLIDQKSFIIDFSIHDELSDMHELTIYDFYVE